MQCATGNEQQQQHESATATITTCPHANKQQRAHSQPMECRSARYHQVGAGDSGSGSTFARATPAAAVVTAAFNTTSAMS
mmetsp:Transcript_13353/g.27246  ORF Transcript_13353/g.27246 Transcript_13353/m.27246 type:complete len:80 (+) Transcript_13353:229-468(+)|eukprot:CAMPEP_0171842606 /NCGR_PEP_ID=MMETSP0992-20121227/15306_1 /TAXON_ID=483369 /ORGANISM="non described non described, Strain CCMP2098" /LENGTH=79 /DNA_ID=CAMNT_0012459907 /DNA_START=177 /DNA_END=416 /DNA_ORIENTATION=+